MLPRTTPVANDKIDAGAALDGATRRLASALDALEAAIERRLDADQAQKSLAAQVQSLGADRSRLAANLDHQMSRNRKLESANKEVARRLDAALESLKSVLEAHSR